MKRILLLLWCLVATSGCVAQIPTVYIDNLVVQNSLKFTNPFSADVGFYLENPSLIYTNSEGPGWMKFNKDGVLYLSSIRVLGVGSGAMVGDASGLTNIMGTNIVGAVLESSHATNADVAVSAANATNLWGQITVTNLPAGVLTNNWNGPTVVITNSSLVVTGAQYFAVSNGAAKVLLTNGTITTSGLITSGGGLTLTGGAVNAGNGGEVTCQRLNLTIGTTATARIANITDSTLVFETGTASKAATNFSFGSTADATNCSIRFLPSGLFGKSTPTVQFRNAAGTTEDIESSGGIYYNATSNGVVSTNVIQPLHTFAALMGYVTNTINGGAGVYAVVTNYSTARTNLMSCSLTAGTITNTIAGYYYVAIHMSMVSLDAGALVEGDLLLNSVERDEVSFQTQFDPGTPRYKGASAFGILYIPANTQITFQIKSSGASGIQLRRQQLVVMPP